MGYADTPDGGYFSDSEYWTNIDTDKATDLIDNKNSKDSFVFVYYRDTCSYSTSMLPLIHYYSTINNINFYALENNSNGGWNWLSIVPKPQITFPLVVVYNAKTRTMIGDSDVHSEEEFVALINKAKMDFNFSSTIKFDINSNYIDFNGEKVETDVPATIINGRTMVPVRIISELFGARVTYIEKDVDNKFRVRITRGDREIWLFEDYKKMEKSIARVSNWYPLDVAPTILNSRTLIPIRAVAEALDCEVDWIGETQTVIIKSK